MVILTGWRRLLHSRIGDREIIILDEGPVCVLASLYAYRSLALDKKDAINWWSSIYKQWAEVKDLLIYLDTNDV